MHDPSTVAFRIHYPWHKVFWQTERQYRMEEKHKYHTPFITIWHEDPETDHTDNSCGWFMRARHGDKMVLEKIIRAFDFNWDRTFTSDLTKEKYACGLFLENGSPHLSIMGVVLNLFYTASFTMFGSRKSAVRYIQNNLFDILFFAENPTDSLVDTITLKFGNDESRDERIRSMASIIYAYILRDIRPWYKHPRWHIHHWSFQVHPLQELKKYLFGKCCNCGRGFKWGENVFGSWSGKEVYCSNCSSKKACVVTEPIAVNENKS